MKQMNNFSDVHTTETKGERFVPYRYLQINRSTTIGEAVSHFVYLCMKDGCDQFKADTEAAGLKTQELLMGGKKAVVAVDSVATIDFDKIQDEILNAKYAEELDGPFPTMRSFNIPVYFEMWARQQMLAPNLAEAMKNILKTSLPKNASYVEDSFHVDDEGDIHLN